MCARSREGRTLLSLKVRREACNHCGRCELACSSGRVAPGIPCPSALLFPEGGLERVCRHCENPPCADGCPAGAIAADQDLGVVLLDESRCVGCRACLLECPFGAVAMVRRSDGSEYAVKCDGCAVFIEARCGPVCERGALETSRRLGALHAAVRRRRVRAVYGLPPGGFTP